MERMAETPIRHCFMQSMHPSHQDNMEGVHWSSEGAGSEKDGSSISSSPKVLSTIGSESNDTNPFDTSHTPNLEHAGFAVAIPYPRSIPSPIPPSLPFIAPLHLQNTETYEQWVEQERAEAVLKRRSISEMEKASPARRRIYPPSCASKLGSPSLCSHHFKTQTVFDHATAQYLPQLLDEPEAIFGSSDARINRARSKSIITTLPEYEEETEWTSSFKGKTIDDESEIDEESPWCENPGDEEYTRWKEGLTDFINPPRNSIATTLTVAMTLNSEVDESLSQLLLHLRNDEPEEAPQGLIGQHIACLNHAAEQPQPSQGRTTQARAMLEDSPDFLFSPDEQARIDAEIEELRKEASLHQSVRRACTRPQPSPPGMLRIQCDPDRINYGTFQYVPFSISQAKGPDGNTPSAEPLGISPELLDGTLGEITVERGAPTLVPKPKKRSKNPLVRAVGWLYEKLFNFRQSVVVVGEQRWDIPTQRFVPRGSSPASSV